MPKYLMESPPRARAVINGKEVDYFSGTGFFDLQGHPEVLQAASEAVLKYGVSSATSSLGYGTTPVLLELEKKIARFFNTQFFMYYVSGCFGNSILAQGLSSEYEIIFIDEESHYSALAAVSSVQKPVIKFSHRNPGDLRQKIKKHLKRSHRPMVMCDGIFPISGELSPLPEYKAILDEIDGSVMCVDDAYATTVIGQKGYGTFEYFGMKGENLYSSGTFSKAAGGHGGIIVGEQEVMEKLMNNSTISRACTPTPIAPMAATAKALDILFENPGLRKQLWDNARYAKQGLRNLGFHIDDSPVPVICLGGESKNNVDFKKLQLELFENDIAVAYIPEGGYTSVPKGGAIRISIFATHTRSQIDHLIGQIKALGEGGRKRRIRAI